MDKERPAERPMPKIVPLQLALLEDQSQRNLQQRFQDFIDDAITALTAANPQTGEMCMPLKAKSKMKVTISVMRTADDCLHFAVEHDVVEAHPRIPGRTRSSVVHSGMGLVQPLRDREKPLFDARPAPAGSPQPSPRPEGSNEP
jgi:hypothetical protein